jgi:hypothetical protein
MTAISGARPSPEALRLTWRQVTAGAPPAAAAPEGAH